jgi:DNA-binding SARP family transcriptional activator
VCAAAGYGKTTALRAWYPAAGARWHRGLPGGAGDPVGALAGAVLEEARAGAGQIVFDDLPRLPVDTARALTEALARLTGTDRALAALATSIDVALASRWPLGSATTALPDTAQAVVGPAELSLPVDRVADLLADEYDVTDWTAGGYDAGARDLPERVHQATAGWPALVHLAAEMLRTGGVPHGDLLPVLAAPGGLIAGYLAEEVLPALPEPAFRLLEHVGDLAPVDPDLCRALGHPSAAETVRLLARCGLLTTAGSPPPVPGGPLPSARIVPVVAEVVLRSRRTGARTAMPSAGASGGGPAGVVGRAAAWFDEHGPAVSAALAHRRCGQDASCARVIERHGEAMLAAGHAETVGRLIAELPAALRTPRLWLFLGDARRAGGDLDAATRAYTAAAPGLPAGSAALAWRMGRLHYHRGDARAMLAALAESGPGPHPPADAAQVSAWTATGHLLAGAPETALRHAREAVSLARAGLPAETAGGLDPTGAGFALTAALAAAQVSVALCLGALGDDAGSDEHYRLAQPVAERIGDVVLLTRIMNNRTYHLLQAARFTEALAAARTCARYAAAARQSELRDIATCNEADALAMLGRFDEAVRQYERAIAGYRRAGSRRVAGAQLGLGEVYRRRGWREQARAAFEAAVRISTETGDGHVRGPAEAGLALVLMADDPDTAAAHAAVAGSGDTPALLAQGWLALHRGDRPPAGELATRACETARAQGDRLGLADALELRGAVYAGGPAAESGRARTALRECHAIWAEAGAAVEAARITVAISRLPGAGPDDRIRGLLAAERMESAGAVAAESPLVSRPAGPAAQGPVADGPATEISVQALGRFEVRVDGEPVPPSRWQSRKARDLLRILVARRGRPVPREELCELLWPDDDPARTGHRLSVLLSIVRGVLDPTKTRAADHYLVADQASIALDVTRVRVDVEDFLSYVARAARLLDAGDRAEARELLVTIDRHHAADAFDDEPYASWSGSLREQTRTAYLSMLRMLAQVCGPASSADAAAGYLLRLLERDPYDEPAHRSLVHRLVRAGRHGEARRAFDRYGQAMREIGVRPPDRSLLAPPASGPPGRGPQAATLNGKYR